MLAPAPVLLAGLVVVVGACAPSGRDPVPQRGAAEVAPAGAASATAPGPTSIATTSPGAATPSATPRPPSPAATVILRSAAALEPAARIPLTPGAEVVVHPAATFEVELSARVADARLVLVDARDDLVAASGSRELAAATRLTLAPAAPLVPGSRYVLRLDGATDRELHDDAGRAFSVVSLPLLAAGAPPPPEPKKPGRKKRRR